MAACSSSKPKAAVHHAFNPLSSTTTTSVDPNALHTPIALAALQAGKHVLCEKPLATTSAEVASLAEAARTAGKLLMAAQQLRFVFRQERRTRAAWAFPSADEQAALHA